jgi:signal transduction histidine kinase/DNA-binding response OmpR family regulator
MTHRPGGSLRSQLTLLTVVVTVAAILLVSWLTERSNKRLLLEHEIIDLRDETNLRASEFQSEILKLSRKLRDVSRPLGELFPPGDAPVDPSGTPEDRAIWEETAGLLVVPRAVGDVRRDQTLDGRSVEWVSLHDFKTGATWHHATRDGRLVGDRPRPGPPPRGLARDLIEFCRNVGEGAVDAVAESAGPVLEENNVCRLYLARRVFPREGRVAGMAPRAVLLMSVNLTTHFGGLARRSPRHANFLVDAAGTILVHPNPARAGTVVRGTGHPFATHGDTSWEDYGPKLAASRGLMFPPAGAGPDGVALPDVRFRHSKKRIPPLGQDTVDRVNAALRADAEATGAHVSELAKDSSVMEISHVTPEGLRAAKKAFDRLAPETTHESGGVSGWLWRRLGDPGADWYDDVACERFVATMIPLPLGLGTPLANGVEPVRFVSAASVEEIQNDVNVATRPVANLTALLVTLAAVALTVFLARLVTNPLGRIAESAASLAAGARRIAEAETDPSKSGEHFAVSLPITGPREVMEVAGAFEEMVRQLGRMTGRLRERTDEVTKANAELDFRVKEKTAHLELAVEQARAAAKAKDTFVANMSHELRQPLHTVIGYTEAIKDEASEGGYESIVPDLDKVLTASRHLLGLINDVLDLARLSADKLELAPHEFPLDRLFADLKTLTDPLAWKNENDVAFPPPGQGTIVADEVRVRQILLNLLSNACKFTKQGAVTLTCRRESAPDGEWVVVAVADTGRGMSPEQSARLFERFYQADDSTRRQQGGTGLGLAITRNLCERMGATISLTSEVGKGSTFTVRIPATPVAVPKPTKMSAPPTPPPPAADAKPGETTVLVIDDDPASQELMSRFLVKHGYRVVVAGSGEDGLRVASATKPNVITLDVMMPGVDGWATLAALKTDADTRDIPVIMVTMVDDQVRGITLGATAYLTKPVDWGRLAEFLKDFPPGRHGGPVLVVEDDPEQREMMTRLLKKSGYESVCASDGNEALKTLDECRPSLILLDLMMPGMDGFDFLAALHRRPGPSPPVVVITAKDLTPDDVRRLNGGVAEVVRKGTAYSFDELVARVRVTTPPSPEGSRCP